MDYIIKIIRKKKFPATQKWIWKLAWHDAKFNLGRLMLFIGSIIIGVAGLTAINGFNDNLQEDIDNQAREILGADLVVENDDPVLADTALAFVDSLALDTARDARFASMVYFPKTNGSRLIQVVAMEGIFPFYGEIETTPSSNIQMFREGKGSMIDESLAVQYGVDVGDSLRLGQGQYYISGIVVRFPGNADIRATISPSVYLPYEKLEETELIQFGSRVRYNKYYKLEEGHLENISEKLKPLREKHGFSWNTVEREKQNMSRGFQNLYRYFNLLSFVALILGSVGVASSVFVYMREKRSSSAVLRCIGAGGWEIFWIFFIQVVMLGLFGSVLGVLIGVGIQFLLPFVVSDFLPIEVGVSLSWGAILSGLLAGMIISILFSALPLANMRFVSPLEILRSNEPNGQTRSRFKILIMALILVFPFLFAVYLTRDWLNGTAFYFGLATALLSLFFISKGLIWIVKRLMPSSTRLSWRLGFSNLFRPNNQTAVLVIVIGLGAFLISTMSLVQNSLLGQVEFVGSGDRSNTVLFDIQPYQMEEVVSLVNEYEAPVQQLVPIVTMRISAIRGKSVEELQQDTSENVSNWRLIREYRVTYRDSLIASETLVEGEFMHKRVQEGDSAFISITRDMAERLDLQLKDEIVFDVQGIPVTTYVGSMRDVDWQRIQTNFMVVFPAGVLEQAPQFYVIVTRIEDKQKAVNFQRALVNAFPNVSMIDLTLILDTLDRIFDKIAFVIRFMALFSIITGMMVLSAAVMNSRYARLKENVMLRTIGAVKKQIVGMTLVEYGYLGAFAGLSGILLSLIGSWILAKFFFDIMFFPDLLSLSAIWLMVAGMTIFIGWANTRPILNRSPLEVLRKEG
jgi:putative ABC transport system permease protein